MRLAPVAVGKNINTVAVRSKNSAWYNNPGNISLMKDKAVLIKFFQLFKVFFCFLLFASPASSKTLSQEQAKSIIGEESIEQPIIISEFNGISLIGILPSENENFDVPIVTAQNAVLIIKNALSLIEINSPFSQSQIEKLKNNGPVIIIYDPRYPEKLSSMNSVKVALFSPYYYNQRNDDSIRHTFLVIVSRHGIKWPVKELAAVLVHELVGHGIQHLNDSWGKMRLVDMECEAWLYEEMAYQNFKIDKFSSEMIVFKKQLEKQCDSFLRYLRKHDPKGAALWKNLNPDVPKLLKHFTNYQIKLNSQ